MQVFAPRDRNVKERGRGQRVLKVPFFNDYQAAHLARKEAEFEGPAQG